MYKTIMENRIVHFKNSFKCTLCHCEIQKKKQQAKLDFNPILEHISQDEHKDKINELDDIVRKEESEILEKIAECRIKKLVRNHITFLKTSDSFLCFLCKCIISGLDGVDDHIKSALHMNACRNHSKNNTLKEKKRIIKFFESKTGDGNDYGQVKSDLESTKNLDDYISLDLQSNTFSCSICKCKIYDLNNLQQHITEKFHKNNLQDQSIKISQNAVDSSNNDLSYKTRPEDFIKKVHYCSYCKVFLKNETMLQCHTMLHLHKEYNLTTRIDIIEFTSGKENIVSECLLCQDYCKTDEELYKHVKSNEHLDRLSMFGFKKIDLPQEHFISVELQEINSEEEKKFELSKNVYPALYCVLCDIPTSVSNQIEHIKGKKHSKKFLTDSLKMESSKINYADVEKTNFNYYTCFICDLSFMDVQLLLEHYKTHEHQYKINCFQKISGCLFSYIKEGKNILCSLCGVTSSEALTAIEHLSGKRHQKKVNKFLRTDQKSSDNKQKSDIMDLNVKKQVSTDIMSKKVQDVTVKQNKSKIEAITIKATKKKNKFEISSEELLKLNSNNTKPLNSSNTKAVYKKNEFKTNDDELMKLGFTPQTVKSLTDSKTDSVDDLLNDLMKLNMTKSQEKKLLPSTARRKPRTPNNTEQKKNNFFEKNVLIYGKDYIKLCIDPGLDNIFNVNNEKLRLIELGVTLTIPWESQRVCLPCGIQLPDNKQLLFEHLQSVEHIQNLQDLEINDKYFEKFTDQYSDLKLAKSHMKESSEDCVQCFVCDVEIENDNSLIHSHMSNVSHIAKSKIFTESSNHIIANYKNTMKSIWYFAQVFVCEVCSRKFDLEIDFVAHLQELNHMRNVNKLKMKKVVLCFDGCPTCITYWFGEHNFYYLHCQDQFHKRFATNGDLKVPNMTKTALEFLNDVEEKSNQLIKESDKVVQDKEKESVLLTAITNTVKSIYPRAKAYMFGSRLSNLGFLDSDVDVFLDCDNEYNKSATQKQSQYYLSSLKKSFEDESDVWIIDEVLLVSRVPIMKLIHIPTGLKCDISFNNGLSVEKSELIRLYNFAYPICRKMILYLKRWLSLCQIFGSDFITTYAISWYVIFYLQIKGILPTVHSLIEQRNESKLVDGWECGFIETIRVGNSDENFKEYLRGFFSYYTDFDYHRNVACPYLGKIIEKRDYAYFNQLPTEMKIYKDRLMNNECSVFRFESPMCIQDPVDLSQNMTKALKKYQLRCFGQYCRESSKIISM